jgi:hypothetical protein
MMTPAVARPAMAQLVHGEVRTALITSSGRGIGGRAGCRRYRAWGVLRSGRHRLGRRGLQEQPTRCRAARHGLRGGDLCQLGSGCHGRWQRAGSVPDRCQIAGRIMWWRGRGCGGARPGAVARDCVCPSFAMPALAMPALAMPALQEVGTVIRYWEREGRCCASSLPVSAWLRADVRRWSCHGIDGTDGAGCWWQPGDPGCHTPAYYAHVRA